MLTSARFSRWFGDSNGKAEEPVFLHVDAKALHVYNYTNWTLLQSELAAGIREPQEFMGKWSVLLPGQSVPEEFSVERGKEHRYDEPEGAVCGHVEVFIKGKISAAGYCGNLNLLDV